MTKTQVKNVNIWVKPVFKCFFTVKILSVRFLLTHPVPAYTQPGDAEAARLQEKIKQQGSLQPRQEAQPGRVHQKDEAAGDFAR